MVAFLYEEVWIILVAFLGFFGIGIMGKQRALVGLSSIIGFTLAFAELLAIGNGLFFFGILIFSFYILYHAIAKM